MSVNITVNGKFGTRYKRPTSILDDPERVKKELEKERRITRLIQVRERSNHLAKKIREDVAAEKARQLKKLEHIKQAELNAWRHHVLVKKHQDYRSAIFQVGAAHRAAQEENELNHMQRQQRMEKMRNCRRIAQKRACKSGKANTQLLHRSAAGRDLNVEGRATAGTQTPVPMLETAAGKENRLFSGKNVSPKTCNRANCKILNTASPCKRKRPPCCRENPNCQCESSDEDGLSETSISSFQSDESEDETETQPMPESSSQGRQQLERTPPIILNVDVQNEDPLVNIRGDSTVIHDRFVQTNRKFCRVVRPPASCPEKPYTVPAPTPKSVEVEERDRRPHFTQISDFMRDTGHHPEHEPNNVATRPSSPTKSISKSPRKPAAPPTGTFMSPTRAAPEAGSLKKTAPSKSPPRKPAAPPTGTSMSPTRAAPEAGSPKKTAPSKSPIRSTLAGRPSSPSKQPIVKPQQQAKRSSLKSRNQQLGVASMQHPRNSQLTSAAICLPSQTQPAGPLPEHPAFVMPSQPIPHPCLQHCPMPQYPCPKTLYPMPHPQQQPQPQQQPMSQYTSSQHPPLASMPIPEPSVAPSAPASQPAPAGSQTTATRSTVSSTTFVMRQGDATGTANSGHVHFYDYNNKFQRNYEAPQHAVQVAVSDPTSLNARDHARIENQLRILREQETEKLRKITDERCQKAMEREQIRRDCMELTEKLDALAQQHPQLLPSDANFIPSHRFEDMAARREAKMTEALEQILLRPAVITCPEVDLSPQTGPASTAAAQVKSKTNQGAANLPIAVNVGDRARKADDSNSSGSCCSILLDYVDNQSKQLHTELKATKSNSAKSEKLKNLLARIEKIRGHLLEELNSGNSLAGYNENVEEVIKSIRKERTVLLKDRQRTLDERETELQQKEELLERKLREFYEDNQKIGDGIMKKEVSDRPVEIIIKVRSDGTVRQVLSKHPKARPKVTSKAPPAITIQTTTEQHPEENNREATTDQLTNEESEEQTSYESASTSYKSLPPVLNKAIQTKLVQKLHKQPQGGSNSAPLHPFIAFYIQRVLDMTRGSINELNVSSSDVPTPGSSIINNSHNMPIHSIVDETVIDERHMERVQAFIMDNRSFVHELEDSLRNHSQPNQERMRMLDDVWMKRLTAATGDSDRAESQPVRQQSPSAKSYSRPTTSNRSVSKPPPAVGAGAAPRFVAIDNKLTQQQKRTQQVSSTTNAGSTTLRSTETQKQKQIIQRTAVSAPASIKCAAAANVAKSQSSNEEASSQMERYAKLTENCTQRIAELTELITKVREEKQRLVEVTLTSASDGERHSTEYFDLPSNPPPGLILRSRTVSEQSEAQYTHNSTPTTSLPLSDQEPLQKNKPIGASRDSGISISRPLTAQGQIAEAEPISLGSSAAQSPTGTQRRLGRAPPATIRRYSPNMLEDDAAHELSTIAEVDTPGQSQMTAGDLLTNASRQHREPLPFPTFEQYVQELKLDLSQVNADQSFMLQQEFNKLVHAIQASNKAVDYHEFPSIGAYLHNMTATHVEMHTQNSPHHQTVLELVNHLRVANVSMQAFPGPREYMQQRLAQQPSEERDLIDSASLENLSETGESLNVEAELRQRRIIRRPFDYSNNTSIEPNLASSTRRESGKHSPLDMQPNESGIEKLSASPGGLSSDLDRELQGIGMHWPTTMRQRQRQAAALGSDSPSPEALPHQRQVLRQTNNSAAGPLNASQLGHSLNLREFLKRELLKHSVHSGNSSDSTSDSLKSNFLQSIMDSLACPSSPQTGTGITNDRQKTSTPVVSRSDKRHSPGGSTGVSGQMFSGESRLSSVHGSPPAAVSTQGKQSTQTTTIRSTSPQRKSPLGSPNQESSNKRSPTQNYGTRSSTRR